jgi:ElaB/YqjD/DUF883 family membrane-anchored ribosome-binding protein
MDATPGGKSGGKHSDGATPPPAQLSPQQKASRDLQDAREKLMTDMKSVITEAEGWLQSSATAAAAGDGLVEARQTFETTLQATKTDLLRLESTMAAKTRIAAEATDAYVKDNPWQAVSIGAAVGMLFGLLLTRK